MSQADLATKLGISQQAISLWVKKNRVPRKWMERLVAELGVGSLTARFDQSLEDAQARTNAFAHHQDRHLDLSLTLGNMQRPAERGQPEQLGLAAEVLFVEALPEALRGNTVDPVIRFAGFDRRFDYVSESLVVELVHPGAKAFEQPSGFAARMHRLSVARAVSEVAFPNRRYVLAVILPKEISPVGARLLYRVYADADLLGLIVLVAFNPTWISRCVETLEAGLPLDGTEPGT